MQLEKNSRKDLKIAIVHDFLVQYGGAERVLEVLSEMFPEAPIYTLLCNEEIRKRFEKREVRTSYLQKFPKFLRKRYHWLLPFFLAVPETFDLRDFDLVISSTGAWSKGIVTRLNTIHVAYLHSPMRFVWEMKHNYAKGFFSRLLFSYVRMWDQLAAQRPDYLIANSKYTQERIKKYYRRDSAVIYPPIFSDNQKSKNQKLKAGSYFLIVSRLSPYKKIDVAAEAFNKLGLPLVVVGEGKQRKYLEKISKNNIKIEGFVSDEKLAEYYQNARALIFPADDDFGMVMVEAMSCGVPVIAFKKGGAKEIVEEGKTGTFFEAQTAEVLADGVRRFMENENNYDKNYIIGRARGFSKEKFEKEFEEFIKSKLPISNVNQI